MRSWFYTTYGGPAVMELGEQPHPELRGPNDLMVKVYAAALNPAQTVATTASTNKLEKMRQLGADEVVDYKHERFERELAGYDFALDCTGEVCKLFYILALIIFGDKPLYMQSKQCLECIRRGGTVVSIAETPTWKSLSISGDRQGLTVSYFIGAILDCLNSSITRRARHAQISYEYLFVIPNGATMDEVRQLAEQRFITPLIDKVFPFENANMAMEYLEAGHAMGKVVVQLMDSMTAN
ncbi:hypothetical protein PsorP6_013758 [Peronosclerospora sorghi]|uniref:Uncharacterized protein n=1 Tax=Peronosclerospora sorghi TaxID=230839 RepID=A0ACC0VFE6_9STRA|nr:hypothetical protein PsorP6_013758 [Peronosclerospora sorghi]